MNEPTMNESEQRIKQLQVLKDIALKVIDFISQFEDELVKIWNKPKFVLNSNYVITLDRIAAKDIALVERLLKHDGMKAQIQEWRDLGIVGDDFRKTQILDSELHGKVPAKQWRFLPFDTKHFKDLELEILGLFDHLDDELDGWLIKSENYQALKTIEHKWHEQVRCVYMDPPFNTSATEIAYVNSYKHASWLSLLADRVATAEDIMCDDAFLCLAIDDYELPILRRYLDETLGQDSHLATVAVRNNPHGRAMAAGFSQNHEYALFYGRKEAVVGRLPRDERRQARYPEKDEFGAFAWMNLRATGANSRQVDRPRLHYPIYVARDGKVRVPMMTWSASDQRWIPESQPTGSETPVLPVDAQNQPRVWNLGWKRAQTEANRNVVARRSDDAWQVLRKYRPHEEGALPNTWWDDPKYSATESGTRILKSLFGERELFAYPKSVSLVEDCLRACNCDEGSLTLDPFAGSGTTTHAVINLNREDGGRRKYVLVEMADYSDTVILPRVKKVIFCKDWEEGKAAGGDGVSHFVKYFQLEQYEQCLNKAKYDKDADLFDDPNKDPYNQYVFLRDPKLLDAVKVDTKKNKVQVDLSRLYKGIDLPETLSNLTGKRIRRIKPDSVEFEDGTVIDLTKQDFDFFKLIKPMVWW